MMRNDYKPPDYLCDLRSSSATAAAFCPSHGWSPHPHQVVSRFRSQRPAPLIGHAISLFDWSAFVPFGQHLLALHDQIAAHPISIFDRTSPRQSELANVLACASSPLHSRDAEKQLTILGSRSLFFQGSGLRADRLHRRFRETRTKHNPTIINPEAYTRSRPGSRCSFGQWDIARNTF